MNWADLLQRTWAEDVLVCPRCAGRMAVLEPVTDPAQIREHLERLRLPAEPAAFAPPCDPDDLPFSRASRPSAGRGPPSAGRPPDHGSPCSSDDFADPPWQEHCQLPLYDDDASQLPPDARD